MRKCFIICMVSEILFEKFKNTATNLVSKRETSVAKMLDVKLKSLACDVYEKGSVSVTKKAKVLPKNIPFNVRGAVVNLTERTADNTAVERELLSSIEGYIDAQGNILPYLFVEGISVENKGSGLGTEIMSKIIKLAKEKYGGRLVLKPENKMRNPSPFYAKCGLRSMTEKGQKEILNYFEHNIPFESGYSDPMYLPVL